MVAFGFFFSGEKILIFSLILYLASTPFLLLVYVYKTYCSPKTLLMSSVRS